uniref:Ion transport domain-containing protein n=1 Tax=Denticeps clupeoides TaxID=299321 RepID=A0AAY4BA94_9TELE
MAYMKYCHGRGLGKDLRLALLYIFSQSEDLYIRQAVVLIEDAMNYRSINHHMDSRSLQLYRWYYSRTCQWFLNAVIAIILGLAFIERPSSLSETSDLRYKQGSWEAPCGMTEGIEMLCILIFALDLAVKVHLIGGEEFWKCKWLMGYMVVITISLIDWMVSLRICCDEVSLLLFTFTFTAFGRRPYPERLTTLMTPAYSANRGYSIFFILFSGFGTFFLFNLLTAVIYNRFRGYLLLSIQTSILRRKMGIRAAFELLSCQAPALSECVPVKTFVRVLKLVEMDSYYRQAIMKVRHTFSFKVEPKHPPPPVYSSAILQRLQRVLGGLLFIVMGKALALANVICICTILIIDSHKTFSQLDDYYLESINCFFIVCYTLEMLLKVIILGWRGYLSYGSNVFDGLLTVLLLVRISLNPCKCIILHNNAQEWEMARLVNMLIVFRFLRVIFSIKLTALVASTVVDLVKNLRAFAGILVVVFYIFAVIGMWLFKGVIVAPANNRCVSNASLLVQCGTYEQLGYWPNNFDDFASALVLLYNVMVVNNWQVFLDVYSRHTSDNFTRSPSVDEFFTGLTLSNFIYKWDRNHGSLVLDVDSMDLEATVELMFRERIPEPTEEEVVDRLHNNPHLHLNLSQNGQHFS